MWKKTNSTLFLLRPLGLINKKEGLSEPKPNICAARTKYGLQNAYIADADHPTLVPRPVFVLFKPANQTAFNDDFLQEEYNDTNSGLKEDYDYPEGNIVLLYSFPMKYAKDYDLIIQGKYSKVSGDFKKIFPFMDSNDELTIYGQVFEKDSEFKKGLEKKFAVVLDNEDELWSGFNPDKETLNIQKILKYGK